MTELTFFFKTIVPTYLDTVQCKYIKQYVLRGQRLMGQTSNYLNSSIKCHCPK